MTNQTPQTHKSVEGKGFPFNVPSVGDIVIAFGKHQGIITEDFNTEDNKDAPMEVINTATGQAMMVFHREMKVIAKPWMKVVEIEVNWEAAKKEAVQKAFEFNQFDW